MEAHPQNPVFIQTMFGKIARRYDLANHVLSLGLDYGWRRRIGKIAAAHRPRLILDLATGSGDLALTLAKYCPEAEVVAADFCLPMLAEAKLKNVPNLTGADGTRLPFANDTFDVLTVAFGLRNMASYETALREFLRVLQPNGLLLVLDFSMPCNFLRLPYRLYLRHFLPRLAGLLTGEKCAYDYLGESIEAFPSGRQMTGLMEQVGGVASESRQLAGGIVSLYQARKSA
ncbi:MAG: ubiquinone/menaquinone biosynthesis methyltransferase [Chthoniobacterales bacterium]